MNELSRPDVRREATAASVRQLRTRLLDLSARNPLISFSHAGKARGRVHIRAVNENLDVLFTHVEEGRPLVIRPLPELDGEPPDEKLDCFMEALELARSTDEQYRI